MRYINPRFTYLHIKQTLIKIIHKPDSSVIT